MFDCFHDSRWFSLCQIEEKAFHCYYLYFSATYIESTPPPPPPVSDLQPSASRPLPAAGQPLPERGNHLRCDHFLLSHAVDHSSGVGWWGGAKGHPLAWSIVNLHLSVCSVILWMVSGLQSGGGGVGFPAAGRGEVMNERADRYGASVKNSPAPVPSGNMQLVPSLCRFLPVSLTLSVAAAPLDSIGGGVGGVSSPRGPRPSLLLVCQCVCVMSSFVAFDERHGNEWGPFTRSRRSSGLWTGARLTYVCSGSLPQVREAHAVTAERPRASVRCRDEEDEGRMSPLTCRAAVQTSHGAGAVNARHTNIQQPW